MASGRGLLGPQPRRARHHLLAALPRRRRRERLHALRPGRASRRRDSAPSGRERAERLTRLRRRPRADRPGPDQARRRHVPPRQDAAHDHAQRLEPLAPRAFAALPRRGVARRGRSLPVEGLRESDHGRAHQARRPVTRRRLRLGSSLGGPFPLPEPRRPKPVPTPETKHFWDGTRAGELRLQRCRACDQTYFPPRPFCPRCASGDTEVFRASGRATLSSYVIHERPTPGFDPPYAIAVVTLEEGP